MNRRDFVKFLGVSSASLPVASALAKMPEVEPKIILLDKPKDIVIANKLPDVDFIINYLVSIDFNKRNLADKMLLDNIEVTFELEFYSKEPIYCFYNNNEMPTFTFGLKINVPEFNYLEVLNGRKFKATEYNIDARYGDLSTVILKGYEVQK